MPVIYSITNTITLKRYIGKTINHKQRWSAHKWLLTREIMIKGCNRHLFNSVKVQGIESFIFEVLEKIETTSETYLRCRELYWMDFYKSCDRDFGYNLRRDSETKCFVSDETKAIMQKIMQKEKNPNFGNRWTGAQRKRMSEIAIARHKSGEFYSDSWRNKLSVASSKIWSDVEKIKSMSIAVSNAKKKKNSFDQLSRDGVFIKTWDSVEDILNANPNWKWQNIYSVCNGYKPTYMSFKWVKREKQNG